MKEIDESKHTWTLCFQIFPVFSKMFIQNLQRMKHSRCSVMCERGNEAEDGISEKSPLNTFSFYRDRQFKILSVKIDGRDNPQTEFLAQRSM